MCQSTRPRQAGQRNRSLARDESPPTTASSSKSVGPLLYSTNPWIATERLSGARFGNTGLKDWSMQDDFFLGSIHRRFDAAIDRIDSRERSPTPREADVKDVPP
jgi:hypothetical protein